MCDWAEEEMGHFPCPIYRKIWQILVRYIQQDEKHILVSHGNILVVMECFKARIFVCSSDVALLVCLLRGFLVVPVPPLLLIALWYHEGSLIARPHLHFHPDRTCRPTCWNVGPSCSGSRSPARYHQCLAKKHISPVRILQSTNWWNMKPDRRKKITFRPLFIRKMRCCKEWKLKVVWWNQIYEEA